MKKQGLKLGLALGVIMATPHAMATNLMQVYKQALTADPTFQAARNTYLANRENIPISRANLLPQLSVVGTTSTNDSTVRGAGRRQFNSYGYAVSLSQALFDPVDWATLSSAKYSVKAAAATYAFASQDLMLRVATAYFNVLRARDVLRFTVAEQKATYKQLQQTKQRYQVGLDTITDVYDTQAQYDSVSSEVIAAKNDLSNSKEQLEEITDQSYPRLDSLKKNLPLVTPKPASIKNWVEFSLKHNLQLEAQRYTTLSAAKSAKAADYGHMPTLDAVGTYTLTNTGRTPTPTPPAVGARSLVGTIGLQLTVPIYSGGGISATAAQDFYNFKTQEDNLEQVQRATISSTRQAYLSTIAEIAKIKADRQAVKSARSALEGTEAAFKVGTRTIVDVLLAQTALYNAQQTYAEDQYDYIINTLTLKQLAGTLSPNDLQQVNSWLRHRHSDTYLKKRSRAVKHPRKKYTAKNKGYTIVLAGGTNPNGLIRTQKQNKLGADTHIIKTQLNGKTWYELAYGNYGSVTSANQALSKLPKTLTQHKPWVRVG